MQQPTRGNRVGSMILDHISMSFIGALFAIPFYVYMFSQTMNNGIPQMFNPGSYFLFLGFVVYFCKDCINGRSLAKRGLELQVVNSKTEVAASPYRCLVRNLFLIIWPIEFIVILINPSQRIGDLIAGTKVVVFDKSVEQPKVNFINVLASIAIGYIIFIPFLVLFKLAQNEIDKNGYDFSTRIEAQRYNDNHNPDIEMTQTILTQLDDSLGELIIPKGEVYNIIDYDLIGLDLSIWVKKWSLDDSISIESINDKVSIIILQTYPNKTIRGNIKYQYKPNEDSEISESIFSVEINPKLEKEEEVKIQDTTK